MKPKPRRPQPARHSLSHQLRELIDARGLTAYELGKLADVDPSVIGRFLRDERTPRLDTVDRIAAALGVRLVEVGQRRGRGRKSATPPPSEVAINVAPDQ